MGHTIAPKEFVYDFAKEFSSWRDDKKQDNESYKMMECVDC